jgi:hypothetical protein
MKYLNILPSVVNIGYHPVADNARHKDTGRDPQLEQTQ